MRNSLLLIFPLLVASGCQKPEKKEEPPVQNTFTEHIDRGVQTMHNAEAAKDAMNARTQSSVEAAKSVSE